MTTVTGIARKGRCPCTTKGDGVDGENRVDPRCKRCLGFGWLWGDGRPPTLCPGGGKAPRIPITQVTKVPCGRAGATCPGCDRKVEDIGLDVDVARTMKARGLA